MGNIFTNILGGIAGIAGGGAGTLVGGALAGGATAGIFTDVAKGMVGGIADTVVSGAQWVLGHMAQVMDESTQPQLNAQWFIEPFRRMQGLGLGLMVAVLAVACAHAVVRQDPRLLLRAGFVHLPLAVVLTVAATGIVGWGVDLVNHMCQNFSGASSALGVFADDLHGLQGENGFIALAAALVVVGGGLLLWVELIVRSSAVEVATLFLPLALATMTWPAASRGAKRLAEILAALVLSKFVIVAVLSLGAGALAHPAAGGASAAGSVLTGVAMLLLACGAPFAVLRLVPLVEFAAVGQLEGMSHRVTTRPVMMAWNPRSLLASGSIDDGTGSGAGVVDDSASTGSAPVGAAPAMAARSPDWSGDIPGYTTPRARTPRTLSPSADAGVGRDEAAG